MSNDRTITFYHALLVCGAAPSIGCGSRAKPLLLDLEQHAAIKEAWLNRKGTMVAIVWRGHALTEDVSNPIFEKHEIRYTERGEDQRVAGSFLPGRGWLRGAEVDRLSLEEAQEIAQTSVAMAAKNRLISAEESGHIESDIEAYFRSELLKFRTKQELLHDIGTKFPESILRIFEKHIGKARTAEVRSGGYDNPFNRADKAKTSSCCSFDPLAAKTPVEKLAICPLCGEKGRRVKSITLQSLLKPEALVRFNESVHHFCSNPGCDAVYFSGREIAPFLKSDLTVRVGIKEDTAPRHVCYCFNHTIEEIEEQLRCSGKITVLEDIKTRMKIACWCETKSPQGSCCVATVTKCVQAVIADQARAAHAGLVKDCASPTQIEVPRSYK